MDRDLSRRIAIARYFMVIGIVILHMPPFQPLRSFGNTPFDMLRGTLTFGVFRATVPFLTAVSAYLLFSSRLDQDVLKLFSKKVRTLVVPLLLWNLPMMPVLYFVQKYGYASHGFSITLYPFVLGNWVDAATGLFRMPLNYPLHFLRNLFALAMLAPLIGVFLRKAPYCGLALVCAVYWYNLDGDYLLRNAMLVMFYIGGLAAVRNWNLRRLDAAAPFLLIVFLGMAVAIAAFKVQNREWFAMLSPLFVWPCMSLLAPTRLGALLHKHSKASFFTFLAHGPMLIFAWLLFQKFGGNLPYFVFWTVTPIIVIPACVGAHLLFWKMLPSVAGVFLGDRGAAPRPEVSRLGGAMASRTAGTGCEPAASKSSTA